MKNRARQSMLIALLCILALPFAVCGGLRAQEAKDAPECEVQVVHLYGTPREKGLAFGAAVKEQVPILVEKYLMALVPGEQSQKTVIERGLSMEKYIPAEYIEEMKAAAEAAGVTYERILVANTFLDVSRTLFCSCFAVKDELTKNGTVIFGRNLDFVHKNIAHKHSVLAIYHGDATHKTFATLTWPGMIGSLSGMNEAGLAIAVMNVHGYTESIEGIPYALLFRMVLERCATVDEAIELVKSSARTSGNNLMVCDSKKNAVVIEMTCKRVGVRRIKSGAIISTNHFRTKELERVDTCPRFSSLSAQIKRVRTAVAGASPEAAEAARIDVEAAAKMLDIVAFNTPLVATMQSIVFLPETLEMDIAAGQLPATSGKFGRFKLADLFKMKKEETSPKESGAGAKEEKPEVTRIPLRVRRPDSAPAKPLPWLGVSVQAPGKPIAQQGGEAGEVGVEVVVVVPNAPAANAGLKVGDVIVGVGEIALKECPNAAASPVTAFVSAIKRFGIGEKKAVCILREGNREQMEAVIGQRPTVEIKTRTHPELDSLHGAEEQSILESALAGQGLTQEYLAVEAMVRATAGYSASQAEILPGQTDPFRLTEVNYLLQNPLDTHLVCDEMARGFESRGNLGGGAKCDLPALLGFAGECVDVPLGLPGEVNLPQPVAQNASAKDVLEWIMAHFDAARKLRDEAFAGFKPEEIELLAKMSDSLADKEVKPADMLGIMKASARIDCVKLFQAGRVMSDLCRNDMLEIVRGVLDVAKIASSEEALPEGVTGALVYSARTPMGLFLVGGKDKNTYAVDAALIIDLGGDDTYANNAGGTSLSMPISVVIDFGGNDTYCAMRDSVQGAGNTGVGILLDVAGNDTYSAGNYAQGCGMYGVGILLDAAGDDMYRGDTCMQGAASFGLGFLIDSDGADRYNAHKFSQAFGSTKGYGALIDAAGADVYFAGGKYFDFREPEKAYQSLSQGFGWGMRPWEDMVVGASGGIGMLLDLQGHDVYIGDYFSQGSSYWYALGMLIDRKGCDNYRAARYSQGAGIHLSIGALLDDEGDDTYIGSSIGVSQGCGHDWALGILADRAGNDSYFGSWLTQGAGNDNGIGILLDFGGNDSYWARNESQGRGNFLAGRDGRSFGFLLDAGGGTDTYSSGANDNSTSIRTQWGIVVDTTEKIRWR